MDTRAEGAPTGTGPAEGGKAATATRHDIGHGIGHDTGHDTGRDTGRDAEARAGALAGALGVRPLDMAAQPVGVRPCSIAAALDILGERWSLLALREMAYGVHRFARIAGFTGASRDILADRLRKLEDAGVVERRPYSEHPPRHEYHLTQAGRDLFPVMFGLLRWGDRWAVDSPAVDLRHDCGHRPDADLVCAHCGERLTRESLTPVPHR